MLIKKKIILIIFIVTIILMPIGSVKAVLQANSISHYTKNDTLPNWMPNVRRMECSGGAMGLNETLNNNLTPSSQSNNIDVHMMKSIEYGGIAILSASGYGNPQKLQESTIKTSTGNKTGVYFSGSNWEYVAGGDGGNIPNGADGRYYDGYIAYQQTSAKVGDALGTKDTANPGCTGWHDASSANWCIDKWPFVRGDGGLFSFSNGYYGSGKYSARGVAICGAGF